MSQGSQLLIAHFADKYIPPTERYKFVWDHPNWFPDEHPAAAPRIECTFRPKISERAKLCRARSVEDLYREGHNWAEDRERLLAERQAILDKNLTFTPEMSEFAKTRKAFLNTRGTLAEYIAQVKKRDERKERLLEKHETEKERELAKVGNLLVQRLESGRVWSFFGGGGDFFAVNLLS